MIFLRYTIIQLFAYLIDISVFSITLTQINFGPIGCNILSKIVAGSFALFAHRNFTFKVEKSAQTKKQAVSYFLLLGLNIPLSSMILSFFLLFIEWPIISKIISDLVCVLFSYLLCKIYIFSSDKNHDFLNKSQRIE